MCVLTEKDEDRVPVAEPQGRGGVDAQSHERLDCTGLPGVMARFSAALPLHWRSVLPFSFFPSFFLPSPFLSSLLPYLFYIFLVRLF